MFQVLGKAINSENCNVFYSNICFKPKQVQCFESLIQGQDVIAVLPTGYGKSLIFQLLPWVLPQRISNKTNIVLVVCPLSSIICDQINVLKRRGIAAASLPTPSIEGKDDVSELFSTKPTVPEDQNGHQELSNDIINGNLSILFGHPESFLSTDGRNLLKSAPYQKRVVACVVDEAHCVDTWYNYHQRGLE